MANKKILILTSTHGDEAIGTEAMKALAKKLPPKKYRWLVANPLAQKANTRYVDADLNRIAPGNKRAMAYESRQAWKIISQAKKYSAILDIHGANSATGIFTIVTNPKPENLFLAALLPIQNIVIWASSKSKNQGPITQFVPCGVEIECGPQTSLKIQTELRAILKKIINNKLPGDLSAIQGKNYYRVYGKMLNKQKNTGRLQNFKLTNQKNENFYPLLVGQYPEIACYKMKKIDFWGLFEYK